MKICVAQIKSSKGNIRENIQRHLSLIEYAVNEHAHAIFFPELSITGYQLVRASDFTFDYMDSKFNPFQVMSDTYKLTIAIGVPTKTDSLPEISMVIFQPGQPRQKYSKQKLFEDEQKFYSPGKSQLTIPIHGHIVGPAICYESMFKDHAKKASELGATLYVASVAKSKSGVESAFIHYPKMAKLFNMPILMANAVGSYHDFDAVGTSAIWDQNGNLLGQLNRQNEGFIMYDTDKKIATKVYS